MTHRANRAYREYMFKFLSIFNRGKTAPPETESNIVFANSRHAGVVVNEETARTYSAVYGAVKVIAESISSMSWHAFDRRADGGKDRQVGPVDWAISTQANPEMTAISWREVMMQWALLWGNGYSEIVKDGAGRVVELWPIKPDRVEVTRDNSGQLVYDISNGRGNSNTVLLPPDIYHLHGLGDDGLVGYSVLSLAAKSIGLGLATESFGSSLFGNGAQLGGAFTHPKRLSKEAKTNLEDSINKKHQGPGQAFKTIVLQEGMEWNQIGIPPEDSQFLATRKFQVTDIARFFRVPPHKLADLERATFTNIEQQNIDFVVDTLLPWVTKMESESNIKFFPNPQRQTSFTKINIKTLLRGDSAARATFYKDLWNMGALSANEIREFEDMNPIGADGDKRFVQLNLTTLENAGEEQETNNSTDFFNSHIELLRGTLARVHRREDNRVADLLKKSDTVDKFHKAAGKFFGQHQEFIKNAITPHIAQIQVAFSLDFDVVDVVARYTTQHLAASVTYAAARYDGVFVLDNRETDGINNLKTLIAYGQAKP